MLHKNMKYPPLRDELARGMTSGGKFTAQESSVIFDLADVNGDGEIDMGEFVGMVFPGSAQLISNLRQNFRSEDEVSYLNEYRHNIDTLFVSREGWRAGPTAPSFSVLRRAG